MAPPCSQQALAMQAQAKSLIAGVTSECWDKCMSTPGEQQLSIS